MPQLTEKEIKELAERPDGGMVRPVEQWREILRKLPPHEAAARIFGDMRLYTADRKRSGSIVYERRDGFMDDIRNLANALQAWANMYPPLTTADAPSPYPLSAEGTPVGPTGRVGDPQ